MGDQGYDGYNLLGIYTTSELAQEAIMDFEDREDYEGFKIINLAYNQKPYVAAWQAIGEDTDYCQVTRWEIEDGKLQQLTRIF